MTDHHWQTNTGLAMADHFIIGIGGVTNGGKTTLCSSLREKFPEASALHMDDYYWPDDDPHQIRMEEYDYVDYERLGSVDMERLVCDVKEWVSRVTTVQSKASAHPPILLIDGIMIYSQRDLRSLFHRKYFFTLTKAECWERRRVRVYEPPDPDGYFKHVWSSYEKFEAESKQFNDIVYLDGSKNRSEILSQVYKDICKLIDNSR